MSYEFPLITRRAALGGMGAAVALGTSSIAFGATGSGPRLVILNIRGGLDGLAAVIPYGDPALAGLRAGLVPTTLQRVDPFFALHPSLPNLFAMMRASEAMAIHAVGPCAVSRSHFEGQDYLQSGTPQLLSSGWLNRALAQYSPGTGAVAGLSVDIEEPLLMRGATPMAGWCLDPFGQTSTALTSQLVALSAGDPALGPAMAMGASQRASFKQMLGTSQLQNTTELVKLASVAGTLLAAPNGPRVATLQTSTVDTHDAQNERLPGMLANIDTALATLKISLGSAWSSTVVLTMTEFGRTAYVNGTGGTDHGTGFAVFLAGGAVAGGRVLARWPGLASNQLFQGRDLAPTVDFRSIAMGVLTAHLGIPAAAQATIFPGSAGIVPLGGLIRV